MVTPRWFPVLLFVAIAAIAWVVVGVSVELWWNNPAHLLAHPPVFPHRPFLEGWARWDASWYLEIARSGYTYRGPEQQASVAFFPGYPLAIRAGGELVGDQARAAILVSLGCGIGVAVMFFRWCAARIGTRAAAFALGVMLTYPFAFYLFGAVYGDALFIAAVLGAFLLLEKDQPVLAGLVGIVATATRPVGAAVLVGLVVRVLEREGVLVGSPFTRVRAVGSRLESSPRGAGPSATIDVVGGGTAARIPWFPRRIDLTRLHLRDFGVLLSGLGLVGYAVYLWDRFGEPLAFEKVAGAEGWEQAPGIHTWFKLALGSRIIHPPYGTLDVALVAQGLITLGLLLLVPAVVRRFGWGYGAYALVIVLLPAISTKDFGGMGRYGLAAFPCLAVIGVWLEPRPVAARVYLGASATLMFLCLILYSHFVYLS
ncbi:MAG: hypothetical protein ACXW1S_01005 [Acidimicrobiia bacterium]